MISSRRTMIYAGLAATSALAARLAATASNAAAEQASPLATDDNDDPNARTAAADDFGHIVRRRPLTVFKAASAADVACALAWAASRRLGVAARGRGHSTYGRAMADVVIDMTVLRAIHAIEPDRITVDAGATWREVVTAALAHRLTPPVLTNYLDLSVGGTLAIGGIGGTSWRHGMQTDNVLALRVVTGDGRELDCSPDIRPDLFDAVRAGLGQCAIITRATLRLMRAPDRVRRYHLFYRDLASLTADQLSMLSEKRFDHLQGAVLADGNGGWRYQLEGVVFYNGTGVPLDAVVLAGLSDRRNEAEIIDLTYWEDVSAFDRLEAKMRAQGQWDDPHPWLLSFLPGSDACDIAGEIIGALTADDIGLLGRVTYYPVAADAFRTPLVRLPPQSIAFPFNLVRMPAASDAAGVERMVTVNRAIYERIRRVGGFIYPVSACPMSPADWRNHFGPAWRPLSQARLRYDPGDRLTPGYELFHPA